MSAHQPSPSPVVHVRKISEAVARQNFRGAFDIAEAALAEGALHPAFFNAKALWLERNNRDEEALAEFERALSLAPNDVFILNAMGMCLTRLLRAEEAVTAFDEAIRVNPAYAPSYYRKGLALALKGDHDEAQRAHERAVALDPRSADALANLASIAVRKGHTNEARDLARRALRIAPGQPTAEHALALADLAEEHFAEAEQRLNDLVRSPHLNPKARAAVVGSIGDCLDGQERYQEAFDAYLRQKAILRETRDESLSEQPNIEAAEQLIASLEATPIQPLAGPDDQPTADSGHPRQHLFLLGFPRSGTTLLEQVLGSHPRVVALEEKNTLQGFDLAPGDPGNPEILSRWRKRYWERIRTHGVQLNGETILLDKEPMATLKLPVIAKLFPDAKILFAVRDPRDVVFSCFRHLFRVQVLVPEFMTLEGTARHYDSVMRVAQLCREKLPLVTFDCRYESMVDDFEGSMRALCESIGMEWSESMTRFHEIAPAVDLRSPSALQIRKPLYKSGAGHWRNYRNQLQPILPILAPWVVRFGYSAD